MISYLKVNVIVARPTVMLSRPHLLTLTLKLRSTHFIEENPEEMGYSSVISSTYDHRVWRTGLPVRSAVLKPHAGQLVVWWVTTCESWLLYVFLLSTYFFLLPFHLDV